MSNKYLATTGRKSAVATPEDMATYSPHDEPSEVTTTTNLPHLQLKSIAEIERKRIEWLWMNRWPLGKITLFSGDPGLGKSHVLADATARVTTGSLWPDGSGYAPVGSVVVFAAEDDAADTIRPRLESSGADLSKVFVHEMAMDIDIKTGKLKPEPFCLSKHLPLLETAIKEMGDVKLVTIDPINSYTGRTDTYKDSEVRMVTGALKELAGQYGIAIVIVSHLNKSGGTKAVYRSTGSLAFAAQARAVWMLAPDLDDEAARVMLPVKCNVARQLTGLRFRIQEDITGGTFIRWDESPVEMTADQFLKEEAKRSNAKGDDDSTAVAEAIEFIREQLREGPIPSKELADAARENNIKSRTLVRARERLNVKARKGEDGRTWMVSLPDGHVGADGNHATLGTLGNLPPDF